MSKVSIVIVFIFLIFLTFTFTGYSAMVGELPPVEYCSTPHEWGDFLSIIFTFSIIFILGFMAGAFVLEDI